MKEKEYKILRLLFEKEKNDRVFWSALILMLVLALNLNANLFLSISAGILLITFFAYTFVAGKRSKEINEEIEELIER